MEHTTYASRLRYLDAHDVDDAVVDYDGLDVRGSDGDKLGAVDGFIVDAQAGRVHYIVVDSGGWFRSQRFLLPIGHARLHDDHTALRVDVTRDALGRYPQFDRDRFNEFSDDDLRAFETRMSEVCCPSDVLDNAAAPSWSYDVARHFAQPEWWAEASYPRERLRPIESGVDRAAATDSDRIDASPRRAAESGVDEASQSRSAREYVTARDPAADTSPHFDGRAQPGDVIGIETGGERTYVGDTAEDENRRRERVERLRADDEPRQSER